MAVVGAVLASRAGAGWVVAALVTGGVWAGRGWATGGKSLTTGAVAFDIGSGVAAIAVEDPSTGGDTLS